ncbi:hypothetical protein MBM_05994 [Drepanopeziza brunnea f. sp. 'multigermtubi' MB_m1]|uniref:Uncharacterized protein n=1 Tax=Marssonina brunnea f. sp. multigermtubi (strain MB_m1) TaxID=1072389 RepID=K1X5Q4_MARBU|nr:uncharacterized protein MBM_05994 [Drepanopeziza brunnea f. sp. 'multigermtubi' MB_m1]EKD15983.1 hypothetical protein MBM_05994 [Drepanopeziza brunnea f. sp. 'multigermtubi' MB_m1]
MSIVLSSLIIRLAVRRSNTILLRSRLAIQFPIHSKNPHSLPIRNRLYRLRLKGYKEAHLSEPTITLRLPILFRVCIYFFSKRYSIQCRVACRSPLSRGLGRALLLRRYVDVPIKSRIRIAVCGFRFYIWICMIKPSRLEEATNVRLRQNRIARASPQLSGRRSARVPTSERSHSSLWLKAIFGQLSMVRGPPAAVSLKKCRANLRGAAT